jgi:hypothetical protein
MNCLISFFTFIGIITTIILSYHFIVDQIGIYKLNKKWKKEEELKEIKERKKVL